jgi:transglutaminase-like putative cysteine protease
MSTPAATLTGWRVRLAGLGWGRRRARPREAEPVLASVLRGLVYLIVTATFAWPLAMPEVALSAAGGALGGALLGRKLARGRLRLPVAVLGAAGLAAAGLGLRAFLVSLPALASWLGPMAALRCADAVGYAVFALGVASGLRTLALRRRAFSVVEVSIVVVAFAQLVVAHRHGAINRPFELADAILAEGGDPTLALLLVGTAAAVSIVVLLLSERELGRALLHLMLAFLLLGATRLFGTPPPPPAEQASGLRLTKGKDDDKEGREHKQGQKQSGGRHSEDTELDFRDNRDHSTRQTPLAVVLLHDDYSPPKGTYYFRQSAFSQYNGHKLVGSARADVDTDLAPLFVTQPLDVKAPPSDEGFRVGLDTSVALLADHTRPFALEALRRIEPAQNPDPGRFRRVYRVHSEAFASELPELLGRPVGDPTWSAEARAVYSEPPKDARYAELAHSIVAELPEVLREDPVAQAFMISDWLGQNSIYSLQRGHGAAGDPTADFLFGDKTGYCVHFAHAAVYMMRALGLPARIGAGYAVDESSRQGGSAILLTGAHSHAWPELFVQGVGWVIADVVPAQSLDAAPPPPDPDLQRLLGELARGMAPLPQGGEKVFQPALRTLRLLREWLAWLFGVGVPAVLLLLYLIKLWRALAPSVSGERRLSRLAYRAVLDRLGESALRRDRGESREAFAARLAAQCPSLGPLTDAHLAPVFGSAVVTPPEELRRLARQVRSELGRAVPWYRRWLGALVPWSWLASH